MVFNPATLFLAAVGYLCLLFLIAHATERRWIPAAVVRHPAVYVLSLGVYATTWSYYGSVGFASSSGLLFATIYIGVTIAFAMTPLLLMPLLRLVRRHQLTSVADLFAFRFDSRLAGVLVTLMILTGSLPYIALQIRAVAESTQILSTDTATEPVAVVFCIIVTVFAIVFGARHVTPREKHSGLVAAIAFESLVKIAALLLVAVIAVSMAFGGWQGLGDWLAANPERLEHFMAPVAGQEWTGLLFLAFAAAFLLPRQFHMLFIENLGDSGLRTASWAFPLFLLLLAAAVPPLLWAGQALALNVPTDYTVLGISQLTGNPAIALFIYLGGISAGSAMIIVSTLALSSMCLNHLVLPLMRLAPLNDLYATLRWVRRALIAIIIAAGYLFYLSLDRTEALVSWGLIAFLAMAQLIPGVLAMLFWQGATRAGFLAGLIAGGAIWGIAGLFPALVTVGPIQLIGLDLGAAQTAGHFGRLTFWTVSVNAVVFAAVSLLSRQDSGESEAANACRGVITDVPSGALVARSPAQFVEQLTPVTGAPAAHGEIVKALQDAGLDWTESRPDRLHQLRDQVKRNLSGMMGPVLARDIVDQCLRLDTDHRTALAQNVRIIEERLERHGGGLRGIAAELDALRRYHRQILEDLPLGVVAVTRLGRIARWNPAVRTLTGLGDHAVLGRHLRELPAPWGALLEQFLKEPVDQAHKRPVSLPAGERWLTLHKAMIGEPDDDENADRLILLEDVTDVQRLEHELAHSERLASIGRLAAGVAHEIGNPVTAIDCLAQEWREEHTNDDRATEILQQTQRITHIVQALVGYAHAGPPTGNGAVERASLASAAEEAERLVRLNPRAKTLHFSRDIPATLSVLTGHQRLVQVFVNFYTNAMDACEPGGKIALSARRQRGNAVIRMVDDGHGIDQAIKDKVIEPFFTTKAPGKGTGLGLSLAWAIISECAGELSIQPRRGRQKGTQVVLRLPLATETEAVPASG